MGLRRPRVHSTGVSNLDHRVQEDWKQLRASRSPLHTSKRYYYQECLGLTPSLPPPPDLNRTSASITQEQYYKTTGRPLKRPVDRVATAPSQANNPFIGGDHDPFIHLPGKTFQASSMTKPESLLHSIQTRYCHHSDLQAVFLRWDKHAKGVLTPEDIVDMAQELGLTIDLTDAQKVVTDTDKIGLNGINYTDFERFIRSKPSFSPVKPHIDPPQTPLYHQLQSQIQSKLPQITSKFLRTDKNHTGFITRTAFCEALNDLGLPSSCSNPQIWLRLYRDMKGTDTGIDYKSFLTAIEAYKPANSVVLPSKSTFETDLKPIKVTESTIIDPQKVPINQISTILAKSRRISRLLREKYPNKSDLLTDLQAISKKNTLKMNDIKEFIEEITRNAPNFNLKREEIDYFLSRFTYNREKETAIGTIIDSIYQSEDYLETKMQQRNRIFPSKNRENAEKSEKNVYELVRKVEGKLGLESGASVWQGFKRLDEDKDGFLTVEDLKMGLERLNVSYNEGEVESWLGEMDREGRGYADYHDFTLFLGKDRGNSDNSAAQPSLSFISSQLARSKGLDQSFIEARTRLMDSQLTRQTRFSSTPHHNNTFLQHQPAETSSLYISEKDRLVLKRLEPWNIAAEDRMRQERLRSAKEQRYRDVQSSLTDSLAQATIKASQLDSSRLTQKAAFREDYERVSAKQRCHLQSAL